MDRTFHAIGQGGFYTEVFSNFKVVYDCGTLTRNGLDLIKREIRATFKKDEVIDAVFISHLHEDHVNGLDFLLEYCKVRRVFLPLLSSDEKLQLIIYNSLISGEYNEFVNGLILDPDRTLIERGVNVYFTRPEEGNSTVEEFRAIDFETLEDKVKTGKELPQNVKLFPPKIDTWVFIPFNFQKASRTENLRKQLEKENISTEDINNIKEIMTNSSKRESIKKAYGKIGNFNIDSQTLYSGPDDSEIEFKTKFEIASFYCESYSYGLFYIPIINGAGCLYLGDYESKGNNNWQELYSRYRKYWTLIGTVQIPHHGSMRNYNRKINQIKPTISIISAGYSNKYKHPHESTIRNIHIDGGIPLIVTERSCSPKFFINYTHIPSPPKPFNPSPITNHVPQIHLIPSTPPLPHTLTGPHPLPPKKKRLSLSQTIAYQFWYIWFKFGTI